MKDLKFACRQLVKDRGFTAVVVLTLALGIGANTTIFSVINGVLLKPLPYPEPDRLVALWERSPVRGVEQERASGPDYLDWRAQNTVFSEMAAVPGWVGSEDFNLLLPDATLKVRASYASASLFRTLSTQPLLGRPLLPEEDRKEGSRAAVLGYGLWQQRFGGDSNVIGRTLTVDTYGRRDYTIVGVMPPGFGLPSECQLWLPLGWMGVTLDERRSAHWYNVIARLKPGVTLVRARAEMNAIQARLSLVHAGETIGSEVAVVPLLDQSLGRNLRTALLVLWGAVAGVLLIGCVNVANLLLVRAASRQQEIALRLALGATRWHVMRQLLLESLVLSLVGGGLGLWFGLWGLRLFLVLSPVNIPRLTEVSLDGTVMAFTLMLSVLTGLLFGLAPAWQFSRPDTNGALREGARGLAASAGANRTRNLFVLAEVALSLLLLVGAALMLQSFARMSRADRGFDPEHLLTAELDFSVSGYTTWVRPTATRPQVPLRQLIERLRGYPGVKVVAAGSQLLRRENQPPSSSVAILGRPTLPPDEQPRADFKGISPGWLRAMGARVLRGRDFSEADTLEAPGVVLINETFARRYFPHQEPIGQRIRMGNEQPPLGATNVWGLPEWSEIVGVVSDVKSLHPRPETNPEVYVPYWQWPMQNPTLVVRATGASPTLAAAIRRETKALIPNLPSPQIRTMDGLVSEALAQPRLQISLLSLFAGLALLLAMVGLYGVLAYAVAQRRQEIGVRLALGAPPSRVLWLVIGHGLKLTLAGITIGILGAVALTRSLRSLLYQVAPTDPLTFAVVALLFLAIALLACWLPARRAAKVDPMQALRCE